MPINALDVSCGQLTRDLFVIAKFLYKSVHICQSYYQTAMGILFQTVYISITIDRWIITCVNMDVVLLLHTANKTLFYNKLSYHQQSIRCAELFRIR